MNVMQIVGEGELDGYQVGTDRLPPYWEIHDFGKRKIPVMFKGPDTIPTRRIRLYLVKIEKTSEGKIGFYRRMTDNDKWGMEKL